MNYSRRRFFRIVAAVLAAIYTKSASTAAFAGRQSTDGNFRYIYGNDNNRDEFFGFLANVFRLQPEDDMHRLISEMVEQFADDESVYLNLQQRLDSVRPFLSELTYGLPALAKQKKVIANQNTQLLPTKPWYEGYLEVGSTGRYLDLLEEQLDIEGQRYLLSPDPATYSIIDIIDRGQISKAGEFIDLNNYDSGLGSVIPDQSIDLATVYIGFHHCPVVLREEFIGSIRDALKPAGVMILRDHNVNDERIWRIVALAHDVFNMGTNQSWEYNADELREFYSLAQLDEMLRGYGFRSDGAQLYQSGDPTLNALMLYRKV